MPLAKNVLQPHFLNAPFEPHRTLLTKNLSLHSDWFCLAERVGFEPTWDCSLTDFESAPL